MGAENVPANMEVNYYKWKSWVTLLTDKDDGLAIRFERAADKLEQNIGLQNEGKWGVESGPAAFSTAYARYLTQEASALRGMATNARNFAAAVNSAIKALESGDETAEENLMQTVKEEKIQSVYISPERLAVFDNYDPERSAFYVQLNKYHY